MLGLFPNTSTVICQDTVSTDRISAGLTRLTIAEFLRNVSALVFVSGDYRHDPARDAWPTGLTNIRLQSGYYSHSFPELVRQNAPTLADLYIYSPNQSTYRHVVQCPDGTTVIYPNLRRLRTLALGYRGPYDAASLPAPQGAPFPALRHLSIADQYPFSNDVLFRGNSTTLEYLALKLTPHLLDVIETYRLLAPGSYPQLHYLSLGKMFRMRSMTEQQAQMLIRMPFELGPNIQVIKTHMFNYPLDSRMLECVWRSKFHSDIRYLNVHSIPLFLTDTVRLVRFLPRLTRLLCRFKGYSAEKTRYIHADDVKRLHAHHFPIRSHLQYFEAGRNPHRSLRLQGELCFMLAILVPSIHHLGCGKHTGSSTSDAIELACKQPAFQEHAGRLDTLRLF
ncbi:hypothetical protein GQ54DRAFT_331302 [Martensiomyces pterosporus]|nr:hypothetical protein GQ54DRAFT_331302 [Martensiomyces pterosporus]